MRTEASSPPCYADDLALVRRCLRGDRDARAAFADRMRFVAKALATINRSYGSPLSASDLADVAQDVFVIVWGKIREFEGRARLESWLYRFAFFEFLRRLRRDSKMSLLGEVDVDAVARGGGNKDSDRWIDAEWIAHALARLPRDEAAVIRLKHFESMTFDGIAARLAISPNTAKSRYYRALVAMRGTLTEDRCGEEASG